MSNLKSLNINPTIERLNFFTEWLPHAILELDENLQITYLNKAAKLQFPNISEMGKNHPVVQNLNPKELLTNFSELIVFERDLTIENIHYEQQIFAISHSHRIYIFMTDTTKRKQAELARKQMESQLAQAQKMEAIGGLTGGIAHDFNNILMIIQGNLQLLQLSYNQKENDSEIKHIKAALEATQRGSALSKRLLNFARPDNLKPTLIVLDEFITEMLKLLIPALGPSIQINVTKKEKLWKIMVDRNQLENAILNLAVNASHSMNGKGKIQITIENTTIQDQSITQDAVEPGDYVKISISDQGQGIPPEIIHKVFDPFFTTKAVGKGTGLGLSMVYGFVIQSKGQITIDSVVNQGTTMNLFFPKAIAAIQDDTPTFEHQNLVKAKTDAIILVVEDEKDIRHVVVEYLKKLGYIVLQADNGEKALNILKETVNISLIFSDVAMPGKYTGIELAKEVQKMYPKIKILITSANLLAKDDNYPFLVKPYTLEDLSMKIYKILEKN